MFIILSLPLYLLRQYFSQSPTSVFVLSLFLKGQGQNILQLQRANCSNTKQWNGVRCALVSCAFCHITLSKKIGLELCVAVLFSQVRHSGVFLFTKQSDYSAYITRRQHAIPIALALKPHSLCVAKINSCHFRPLSLYIPAGTHHRRPLVLLPSVLLFVLFTQSKTDSWWLFLSQPSEGGAVEPECIRPARQRKIRKLCDDELLGLGPVLVLAAFHPPAHSHSNHDQIPILLQWVSREKGKCF